MRDEFIEAMQKREDGKDIDYSYVAELVRRDREQTEPGWDADEAGRNLFNGIGDIVQITVEETLSRLIMALSATTEGVITTPRDVRRDALLNGLQQARNVTSEITERVMERLAKGEAPYGARQKQEDAHGESKD